MDRHLRVVLQPLGGCALPAGTAVRAPVGPLCRGFRHRRAQREFLSLAEGFDVRRMARPVTGRLQGVGQGASWIDALPSAVLPGAVDRALRALLATAGRSPRGAPGSTA